jgi:hypothetical protein
VRRDDKRWGVVARRTASGSVGEQIAAKACDDAREKWG